LIATAFLGTTLQARIDSTQDVNKDSYLKAIADRIVTGSGDPVDWGAHGVVPSDFGLATNPPAVTYELDIDKVSRLSNLNDNALSYLEVANAAKLSNIAIGIEVSQTLTVHLSQTNNYTIGQETYIALTVSTTIESKPTLANLRCYIIADNYQYNITASTLESGTCALTVHFPTENANDALLVVFARAPFDERITSYATYNLADSIQETAPAKASLALSPLNYALSFNESSGASLQRVYLLSYSYQQAITNVQSSPCAIPKLIDHSPNVLVTCGQIASQPLEEWTSYPQIPLTAGSSFANSERNVFSYMVTIDGVLYKLEVTLGDLNP
jgi:hypothetical protein